MPAGSSSPTTLVEALVPSLTLESTLRELLLHNYQIESHHLGKEVVKVFDENPVLPGFILTEDGQFAGMVSRRRFLEQMSRPYGLDLFLNRSLKILYPFVCSDVVIFPSSTPIVSASWQALGRSPAYLYEPIVIELEPEDYRLLDVHQLLIAQAQIHELAKQLIKEQTQAQMIQTEKMASLGRIIASVAHEILNPVNFIFGNLSHLSNYTQDLIRLLSIYEAEVSSPSPKITATKEAIGLDFLLKDLPQVIDSIKLGSGRLKSIAGGLRTFSHMNESDRKPVDLHKCIDSTLLILNTRLKNDIEVVKHYGELPLVSCYSGQLSQVFMNIMSNAVDALMEKAALHPFDLNSTPSRWQPQIKIVTEVQTLEFTGNESSLWIAVRIADNGPGIPPEIQKRVFETFFTTKPVGQGTGLGLAISHQIVTEKHGGRLNFKSEAGIGTEFEILLPLNP